MSKYKQRALKKFRVVFLQSWEKITVIRVFEVRKENTSQNKDGDFPEVQWLRLCASSAGVPVWSWLGNEDTCHIVSQKREREREREWKKYIFKFSSTTTWAAYTTKAPLRKFLKNVWPQNWNYEIKRKKCEPNKNNVNMQLKLSQSCRDKIIQ